MEKRRGASKSTAMSGPKTSRGNGNPILAPSLGGHEVPVAPRGGVLLHHHHHGPSPQQVGRDHAIYVPAPTPPPRPPSAPMPTSVAPHHGYMTLLPAPVHLHHSHATTTAGLSAGTVPIYTAPMSMHSPMALDSSTMPVIVGPGAKADGLTRANIQDLLKQQPPRPASGLLQSGVGGPHHHVYAYHHAAQQEGGMAIAAPAMGLPMAVAAGHHLYPPFPAAPNKDEEKKRQKRALNRQSAQRCRKRKRAMLEELQTANQLFSTHAAILESLCSTNLAFMYRTGTITYVQGTRRLGFEPEELETQDIYSLLEPTSSVRVKQLLSQLIDDWENTTNEQESGSSNQGTPTGSDNGAVEANGYGGNRSHGSDGSEGSDSVDDEDAAANAHNNAAAIAGVSASASGATPMDVAVAPRSSSGSGQGSNTVTTSSCTSGGSSGSASSSNSKDGANKRQRDARPTTATTSSGSGSGEEGTSSPASSSSPPPSPGGCSPNTSSGTASSHSTIVPTSRPPAPPPSTHTSAAPPTVIGATAGAPHAVTAGGGNEGGNKRESNPSSSGNGSSSGSGQSNQRFTSKEPGSSTNSNISQLLPYGFPQPMCNEFTYQIRNLSFVARDGSKVAGDVHGVITLDESLGKEPECIWSVRFAREAEFGSPVGGAAKSSKPLSPSPIPTAPTTKKPAPILDHPYTSSSEDSPPTSSGESPPPRVTHGSSKVPTAYSGSKVSSSEPTSSEGSMDVSNEDDSDD